MLLDNMKFTRKGTDTVAGLRCTVWGIQGQHGSGTGCITDDGVVLRADSSDGGNGRFRMTAKSVSYGRLDDKLFQPPAGYQQMQIPGTPPGVRGYHASLSRSHNNRADRIALIML